jgi:mRNA-degrading endonuclease RelE of RelBE toxin-antitoxin system
MVSVSWSTSALHDLDRLDTVIAKRIVAKVGWLGANFAISSNAVKIEAVKHRGQAYR